MTSELITLVEDSIPYRRLERVAASVDADLHVRGEVLIRDRRIAERGFVGPRHGDALHELAAWASGRGGLQNGDGPVVVLDCHCFHCYNNVSQAALLRLLDRVMY